MEYIWPTSFLDNNYGLGKKFGLYDHANEINRLFREVERIQTTQGSGLNPFRHKNFAPMSSSSNDISFSHKNGWNVRL